MQEEFNQNTSEELIVKYNKASFKALLLLFIPLIPIVLYLRWRKMGHLFTDGLLTFIPPFAIIFGGLLYFYFNNTIKLKISEKGIWTKKYNLVEWERIWYFDLSVDASLSGGNIMYFHFKLRDSNDEFKIPLNGLDCSLQQLNAALQKFAPKDSVINLGFSEIT